MLTESDYAELGRLVCRLPFGDTVRINDREGEKGFLYARQDCSPIKCPTVKSLMVAIETNIRLSADQRKRQDMPEQRIVTE